MRKPSLMLVTRTARVGGAERMVLRLAETFEDDFAVSLAVVSRNGVETQASGLSRILFGRASIVHSHLFLPGLLIRLRRIWDGGFRWVHTVHYDAYESQKFSAIKRWIDHHLVFRAVDSWWP